MQYLWFDPFRSFASVGRWLHGNFPHWHWSSAGQEMLASWHDFMSYTPDRDDRFEEGERKSRGNGEISWKQRLKQLASVVHLGLRKHEIMDMYGGHDLYPAVAGTYWLHKTDFERLSLSKEVHLFQEIWKIVGRSLLPSIKKCQVKRPCACHFVACNLAAGEGELSALELRSTSFEWPKLNTILPTTAAPGVKYLALEGKDAFKHPEFWLQAFPAIKVLQLFVPSYHIENVAILLQGWRRTCWVSRYIGIPSWRYFTKTRWRYQTCYGSRFVHWKNCDVWNWMVALMRSITCFSQCFHLYWGRQEISKKHTILRHLCHCYILCHLL